MSIVVIKRKYNNCTYLVPPLPYHLAFVALMFADPLLSFPIFPVKIDKNTRERERERER